MQLFKEVAAGLLTIALSSSGVAQTRQEAPRTQGTESHPNLPRQTPPVISNPIASPSAEHPQVTPPTGSVNQQEAAPNPKANEDGTSKPEDTSPDFRKEPLLQTPGARPVPPRPVLTRTGVSGGQTVPLSLNDAVRMALQNNNDIEIARDDVRLAETRLQSLEGVYDPVLNLSPQVDSSILPTANSLGGSTRSPGSITQTDFALTTSVTKRFSAGGGQYQFFFNNMRRTTNSVLSQLSPFFSSDFGVAFTQPLLRDRSIDRSRRDIRVERKHIEQSDADFRRRTIDAITEVERAYWELVFALNDQQNREANLDLAREQFRNTEARVAEGESAPIERAEVETEISIREADLIRASRDVTLAENNLKQRILNSSQAGEWSAQIMPVDQPTFGDAPVNLDEALKEARSNRPEMQRIVLEQEANEIDRKFLANQTHPRIDLQASVSTTGLAGTRLGELSPVVGDAPLLPNNYVGGYGQTLGNLFDFNAHSIVVGVNIEIPLRNRTARADLAGARIQHEQIASAERATDQSIEAEVRNAVETLEAARRTVLTARSARQSAELQAAGERKLYNDGRSTTFLVFQRDNALANARTLELRAETDFKKATADLQRASSTTLKVMNVKVETTSIK